MPMHCEFTSPNTPIHCPWSPWCKVIAIWSRLDNVGSFTRIQKILYTWSLAFIGPPSIGRESEVSKLPSQLQEHIVTTPGPKLSASIKNFDRTAAQSSTTAVRRSTSLMSPPLSPMKPKHYRKATESNRNKPPPTMPKPGMIYEMHTIAVSSWCTLIVAAI